MDGAGQLAILGAGRMGEALLGGLLRAGWIAPERVHCTVRSAEHAATVAETHGVRADTDSASAAAGADIILLTVKPQNLRELLGAVGDKIHPGQVVISVAAGVPTSVIESQLPEGTPVVRVMSNTPVEVDQAMSVVAPGRHARDEHADAAAEILGHVGRVLRLPEEHLDTVTALSGSGPAYVYLLAESLIDAGVLFGLSRDAAAELVVQMLVGSATMLRDSGRSASELRAEVASPGGVTISALRALEDGGLRSALTDAVEAARTRGRELASG
jgi:pyrroline-5-carboxylate reductase